MSSDEIFAAQMWTWPGPMLKRDAAGRVVVVNAAFLQMYGGRVEDWRGNTVTGWPAPQPPGSSSRFEARMPQADGSEAIYDWIETALADGSALAIARDVTAYAVQTPAIPAQPEYTAHQEAQMSASVPAQEHDWNRPAEQAPTAQTHTLPDLPASPPAQHSTPDVPPEVPVETHIAPPTVQELHADPVMETPPPATPPPPQEPERDFERRALPIENGDSVLGNNWRDAVIAKAVAGNEDQKTEPDSERPAAAPKQKASNSGASTSGSGVRILLAEDNAINALLTRTLLEAEGCVVEVVEDGQLAVEAMKNAHYDMIFMDMRMPNMDGLEATRKIRAMDHRSKGLPIVALTANAFDDDRNACFDSGMNDFMTKPVSAEELSEMVKTHTGGAQRMAS